MAVDKKIHTEWVVISGAPSSGKSTLVETLSNHLTTYTLVPEITRAILQSDIKSGKIPSQTPEYNDELNRRIFTKKLEVESGLDAATPAIMDRGVLDVKAYARYYSLEDSYVVTEKQYKSVFLMEPLSFVDDAINTKETEFSQKMHLLLYEVYTQAGYTPIVVPDFPYGLKQFASTDERKTESVDQRKKFILTHLGKVENT